MLRVLSLLEARVLVVLVEKQRTVPDSYPLSLNALVAGCNQKSSRDPVLNAAETDVQAAVDGLKSMVPIRQAHKANAGNARSRSGYIAGWPARLGDRTLGLAQGR